MPGLSSKKRKRSANDDDDDDDDGGERATKEEKGGVVKPRVDKVPLAGTDDAETLGVSEDVLSRMIKIARLAINPVRVSE